MAVGAMAVGVMAVGAMVRERWRSHLQVRHGGHLPQQLQRTGNRLQAAADQPRLEIGVRLDGRALALDQVRRGGTRGGEPGVRELPAHALAVDGVQCGGELRAAVVAAAAAAAGST